MPEHPFYCKNKKCRKTAWDTPEYLTESDWRVAHALTNCVNVDEFKDMLFDAYQEKTAEGLFCRVLGWPEGLHYCRDVGRKFSFGVLEEVNKGEK